MTDVNWVKRLMDDSGKIPYENKTNIIKSYLRHIVGLSEAETNLFARTPVTHEELLQYSLAEQKVSKHMKGIEVTKGPYPEFYSSLEKCLEGIYTETEIKDLCSLLKNEMDVAVIFVPLAGLLHPLNNKIYRAYKFA